MSKTITPTAWLRLLRINGVSKCGRYPSFLAATRMRSLVFAGIKRASGASFNTNETVVDENPLARATSRIVTDEAPRLRRLTIKDVRPPKPKSERESYIISGPQ